MHPCLILGTGGGGGGCVCSSQTSKEKVIHTVSHIDFCEQENTETHKMNVRFKDVILIGKVVLASCF